MARITKHLLPILAACSVIACIWIWGGLAAMHVSELQVTVVEIQNPDAPPNEWKVAPLPGAEVIAVWGGSKREDSTNWHSGNRRCMGLKTALTNSDGKAIFPKWRVRWGDHVLKPTTTASIAGYIPASDPNHPGVTWHDESGRHFMRRGHSPDRSSREVAKENCRGLL